MAVAFGPIPLEQAVSYSVDRASGKIFTRTWVGPVSLLEVIRLAEEPFAESLKLDPKKGQSVAVLTGRYLQTQSGTGEIPTETQEIDVELIQQSIFFNPTFQILTQAEQKAVRDTFAQTDLDYAAGVSQIQGKVAMARWYFAIAAYDLLIMGAETYDQSYYVLNRTRTCSRRYSGKLNLKQINTLWTTDELVNYTGNGLLFDTPSITVSAEEASKNLFAGWRQKVCKVSDTAAGSRQMVEQWLLGKHSQDLYIRMSDPTVQ